jgi:hypothetical protein
MVTDPPPNEPERDVESDPLFLRAGALGASLRRVDRATERSDADERSVWHLGTDCTELTTWEDAQSVIQRQELVFLGMALEYRRGHGLRTGNIETAESNNGVPTVDRVRYDTRPAVRVVELAARLLRESRRDYYTQHLLKHLNDSLTTRFDRPQTLVYGLARWRDRLRRASNGLGVLRANKKPLIYLAVGLAVGALLTLGVLAITTGLARP